MKDAAEILLEEAYQIADGETAKIGTSAHVKALVTELRATLAVVNYLEQVLLQAKGGRQP